MTIDKALLRLAWPDGYLAMRGVLTVGGWTCLGPSLNPAHRGESVWLDPAQLGLWVRDPEGQIWAYGSASPFDYTPFLKALEEGDLLPNVDPEDTATWAACLADLATVAGWTGKDATGERAIVTGYTWGDWLDQGVTHWTLTVAWNNGRLKSSYTFDLDTDDPALALVLALVEAAQDLGDQ
jgi:hypothetical protein